MTKTNFFAMLYTAQANKELNVTAHISVKGMESGFMALVINQFEAPNHFISKHRDNSGMVEKMFTKYNAWLNEWLENQNKVEEMKAVKATAPAAIEVGMINKVYTSISGELKGRVVNSNVCNGKVCYKIETWSNSEWVNIDTFFFASEACAELEAILNAN